jgi:hypothetical protein
MKTLTPAQRTALHRKWAQDDQGLTYLQFRRTAQAGWGCVMVRWSGMWLGVEPDGYTHS